MKDRGGYGAIAKALIDGPDYQTLPSNARLVFLTLKLMAGPSGIWVEYPPSLTMRLAAQTGLSFNQINETLAVLEEAKWIQRERHVIWIVGHLRYHPHNRPTNEHHRSSMHTHIAGLPRLPIVRRFVEYYPEYFGDAPKAILDSLPASGASAPDIAGPDAPSLFDLAAPAPQSPQAKADKTKGDNGLDRQADSLLNSLSGMSDKTAELAFEIGAFCRDNDCKWRLQTPIEEWANEIRHEPKYAGVDHAYEVRRCNEWHQGNGRTPKAPDRSIRNWLEKAMEMAARRFHQQGERPTVRDDYDHLS